MRWRRRQTTRRMPFRLRGPFRLKTHRTCFYQQVDCPERDGEAARQQLGLRAIKIITSISVIVVRGIRMAMHAPVPFVGRPAHREAAASTAHTRSCRI